MHQLTGKKRFRTLNRMFRKPVIVLDVEVLTKLHGNEAGYVWSRDVKMWIDASPDMLINEGLDNILSPDTSDDLKPPADE